MPLLPSGELVRDRKRTFGTHLTCGDRKEAKPDERVRERRKYGLRGCHMCSPLVLARCSVKKRRQVHATSIIFIVAVTMLQTTRGFLSSPINSRTWLARSTRLFSNLDDLMEDLLNNNGHITQNVSSAAVSEDIPAGGWRNIDWKAHASNIQQPVVSPSPVDVIMVRDRLVYLKRDDQLRLPGSQVSGNKARKMLALNELTKEDFPTCLVSYGGPQSNAMLALAAIVRFQNEKSGLGTGDPDRKRFVYYAKKLPRFLRNQPNGNLFRALSLGMELVEVSAEEYNDLFGGDWGGQSEAPKSLQAPVPRDSVWVPQGGACGMAQAGTELLAKEIVSFWGNRGKGRPLSVCVPGGTCSTAALLHRSIQKLLEDSPDKLDIAVVVIPCIGDDAYARRQMMGLNTQTGGSTSDLPAILAPSPHASYFGLQKSKGYYSFGAPDASILETFRELRDEHEVVLDLLYGAPSWTILLRHWRTEAETGGSPFDPSAPLAGREVMYVHSGGLEGISSQLLRYRHKGLIAIDEVQLPGRL